MQYGDFSADGREYIINRPDTPTPWINYISNLRGYCGIISQAAGGFSFHRDPRDRRIMKYRYNNVPVDRPGRYIYLKDLDDNAYFSPTWQPVQATYDSYQCRHGQGYTVISQQSRGLATEVLYFVPTDADCEVWRLKIKNTSGRKRRLSVYPYVEFTMWCEPESRNIQWSLHLTKGSFDRDFIIYNFIEPHPAFDMTANKNYVGDRPGFAFLGMSLQPLDFECVRDRFIGMYRSEANPAGLDAPSLGNSVLRGGVGCGAMRGELELAPGEETEVTVVLGYAEDISAAEEIRSRFSVAANREAAWQAVRDHWTAYLGSIQLSSPDAALNLLVNVWNQYQCKTTFDWSRYISFYENGEGRGMGTRDSCQDTLAINSQMPGRCRKRIFQILETTQFDTGDCYHQFFPNGGKGDLKGFSDDQLWMPQMVHAYIAETGDSAILREQAGFADSRDRATVYEHLVRGLDYTARMTGPHGLPLILTADWNDTLHLWMECEKPESTVTAGLYVQACQLTAELAELSGRSQDAADFRKRAQDMAALVNKHCWDGEWYVRGFGSEVIGTHTSARAKIFLNSQVWSVISGLADPARAQTCMESVRKHLASPDGVKKVWPPFNAYDQTYGLISRYNIGRKENGIFAHAHAWAVVAETILGNGDRAFDYYASILPLKRNDRADILKTEPYVFCQTVCTNDSHNPGEGGNSWLTGTASWMYVAATQYLLGIKPTLQGLRLAPCLPSSWPGFSVRRRFRNAVYDIHVTRTGKRKLTVNGKEVPGDTLAPAASGTVKVELEM